MMNKNKVYPRVCGGTLDSSMFWRKRRGLSPRVRGNRTDRTPVGLQ